MRLRSVIAVSVGAVALWAPAGASAAATLFVNTTADMSLADHPELCDQAKGPLQSVCTLRAASEAAATLSGIAKGASEVVVSVPSGHFTLSRREPLRLGDTAQCRGAGGSETACPLTLAGAGADATAIDGEGATGLIGIAKGAGAVTISGLTLTGASSSGGALEDREGPPVAVLDSRLSGNSAPSGAGAAVQLEKATMRIARSAIEGNRARADGAILLEQGTLALERSSVTGNEAPLQAAAIGALEGSHLTLVDTTVAANGAGAEGAIVAGTGSDVAVRDATLAAGAGAALGLGAATSAEVEGSIVSGAPGIFCAPGVVVSSSAPGILRGGAAGCTTAGVPPSEADPVLGAPTQTGLVTVLPLLRGSAAVNAGGASCPGSAVEGAAVDERGVPRPLGAGCDLGAFESAADATVSLMATPDPPSAGSQFSLTATVSAAGADALSGLTATIALPPLANLASSPAGCTASYLPATVLTCSVGALAAGSSRQLVVNVRPLEPGTLGLAASVQADQADYAPGDDGASLALPVIAASPLRPAAVLVSRTLHIDRQWNALARLRCVGARIPCTTALVLYGLHGPIAAHGVHAAKRLAGASSTVGAGRTVTVAIPLPKRARKLLRPHRRARVRLLLSTGLAPPRRALLTVTLVRGR